MTNFSNPMGTEGFEFLEFSGREPEKLEQQFQQLGFKAVAKHRKQDVILYRQGQCNFILNRQSNSQASRFAELHGSGVCAMGFRVKDAKNALRHAMSMGASAFPSTIPSILGIGSSVIYFVDCHSGSDSLYARNFDFFSGTEDHEGLGLTYIDHVTHNVQRGHMDKWAKFYEVIFNFREIRYFDIHGAKTGLLSRAMTSPCNKIRIPINEPTDDKSQIQEYLDDFKGEGIQHIALGTSDIYHSVSELRNHNIEFLNVPDTYYDMIAKRIPWHNERVPELKNLRILIDGGKKSESGLLLQIFTQNMMGPVFFEIIHRKGNDGFGEGNFQALFEAIEQDQIRRGVL